jgi:hypothetical protein
MEIRQEERQPGMGNKAKHRTAEKPLESVEVGMREKRNDFVAEKERGNKEEAPIHRLTIPDRDRLKRTASSFIWKSEHRSTINVILLFILTRWSTDSLFTNPKSGHRLSSECAGSAASAPPVIDSG